MANAEPLTHEVESRLPQMVGQLRRRTRGEVMDLDEYFRDRLPRLDGCLQHDLAFRTLGVDLDDETSSRGAPNRGLKDIGHCRAGDDLDIRFRSDGRRVE